MFGLNFNRLPRHRQFDYKPVYFNPEKEELDERVSYIRRSMGEEEKKEESIEERIRAGFKHNQKGLQLAKSPSNRFYGLRIVLIGGFLTYVFYKLLNTNILETIFRL
ncbi:hypothetical protein GYB22_03215 [bacterium]|nr:hypothetical protein [bacterium]